MGVEKLRLLVEVNGDSVAVKIGFGKHNIMNAVNEGPETKFCRKVLCSSKGFEAW